MRRPLTWASGGILAAIFLAIAALVTHSAAPAPASTAVAWTSIPAPPPVHHAAARADQYARSPVHTGAAAEPLSYTAQHGDTLSSIARAVLGHANRWPALWYANRKAVRNPDALRVGTQLSLAVPDHPVHAWLADKAMAAIPRPPAPEPAPHARLAVSASAGSSAPVASAPAVPAAAPAAAPATGSVVPGSGYEACVIDHESSGNAAAVNPSSGAGGLYGFLPSTWQSLGYSGLPENAPVAEQQQAFSTLYAQAGRAPWMTDGC